MPLLPLYAEKMGASNLCSSGIIVGFVFPQPAPRDPGSGRALGPHRAAARAPLQHLGNGGRLRRLRARAQGLGAAARPRDRRHSGRQHFRRPRVHRGHHQARKPSQRLRAHRRRFRPRLHPGAGARRRVSQISYTAPIWVAALLSVSALVLAWAWLPETVEKRTGQDVAAGAQVPALRDDAAQPRFASFCSVDFRLLVCGGRVPDHARPHRPSTASGWRVPRRVTSWQAWASFRCWCRWCSSDGRGRKRGWESGLHHPGALWSRPRASARRVSSRTPSFSCGHAPASIGTALFMPALTSLSRKRCRQG